MSFFKEIMKPITGIIGGIGKGLNSVTGQTSAGKVNQKYAKELAAINQKYALESGAVNQKYALQSAKQAQQYAQANMAQQYAYEKQAAQNAHQWEIQDLQKAGLNPILSTGGQGAQADAGLINASVGSGSSGYGSAGAGSQGAANINILDSLTSAGKTMKEIGNIAAQTENTGADTALKTAQTAGQIKNNEFIEPEKRAQIANTLANATLNSAKTTTEKTQQALNAEKSLTERSTRQEKRANAKFQNERARGYTKTTSESHNMHFLGSGAGGSVTHSKTR